MVTFVVVVNGLIAGLGFWTAWKLWRLRQQLVRIDCTLVTLEAKLARSLPRIPASLGRGQGQCRALRQRYRRLLQVRQVLTVVQWLWNQRFLALSTLYRS
jgi:hypothetical protein